MESQRVCRDISAECKIGTLSIQGQFVRVIAGNLSYPLSPLSLPGPAELFVLNQSRGETNHTSSLWIACGLKKKRKKNCRFSFASVLCHIQSAAPGATIVEHSPKGPRWINGQGSKLDKQECYALALHHWEAVVCFSRLCAVHRRHFQMSQWEKHRCKL